MNCTWSSFHSSCIINDGIQGDSGLVVGGQRREDEALEGEQVTPQSLCGEVVPGLQL